MRAPACARQPGGGDEQQRRAEPADRPLEDGSEAQDAAAAARHLPEDPGAREGEGRGGWAVWEGREGWGSGRGGRGRGEGG